MHTRKLYLAALLATATAALVACDIGPTEQGSFDRTLAVSTPLRLELANSSGSVRITGASSDGKVHIHGDVTAGSFLGSAKEDLQRVINNPPIEQHGGLLRIGKEVSSIRNTSISYTIEVPQETELSISAASGAQEVSRVRGPVTIDSASGSVNVDNIDRTVQIKSASGSIRASNLGDDARIISVSGTVEISSIKGD